MEVAGYEGEEGPADGGGGEAKKVEGQAKTSETSMGFDSLRGSGGKSKSLYFGVFFRELRPTDESKVAKTLRKKSGSVVSRPPCRFARDCFPTSGTTKADIRSSSFSCNQAILVFVSGKKNLPSFSAGPRTFFLAGLAGKREEEHIGERKKEKKIAAAAAGVVEREERRKLGSLMG